VVRFAYSKSDAERLGDHVARDRRALEHRIDQCRQLGGRTPLLELAREPMSPRESPIVVFESVLSPEADRFPAER
jgi:hypothetical protein